MIAFQVQFEAWLRSFTSIAAFMQMRWAWPAIESAHFIGLTLLFGSIAAWDLRLVGAVKEVPISAFHRLVPFAVLGFAINVTSGFMFLVTFPEQYVYNPAFQLKVLCLMLAGLNVMLFYLTSFRRIATSGSGQQPPLLGRLSGAVSLGLWITVIVCGRMITFFGRLVTAMPQTSSVFLRTASSGRDRRGRKAPPYKILKTFWPAPFAPPSRCGAPASQEPWLPRSRGHALCGG